MLSPSNLKKMMTFSLYGWYMYISAACVACGNFVLCFPEESRSTLPALYPLFFNNLQDNIPSVRQGAALALSNVVRAYGRFINRL